MQWIKSENLSTIVFKKWKKNIFIFVVMADGLGPVLATLIIPTKLQEIGYGQPKKEPFGIKKLADGQVWRPTALVSTLSYLSSLVQYIYTINIPHTV